jgi:preprotein translocase subunit SecE
MLYINKTPERVFLNRKNMSFTQYLKDTKAEMKHVNWPTRSEAINYTVLVIVISFVVAGLLALFDAGFSFGLSALVTR